MSAHMHVPLSDCHGFHCTPGEQLSPPSLCPTFGSNSHLAAEVHGDHSVTTSTGPQTRLQYVGQCGFKCTSLLAYMGIMLTKHHVSGTSCSTFWIFPTHTRVALRSALHCRSHAMGRGPDTYMVRTCYLKIAFHPGDNLFPPASLAPKPRYMVRQCIRIMAHATCRTCRTRALCQLVPQFSYSISANAAFKPLDTNSSGAMPPGGGPISFSYLMNSEFRSNLQVQWVKLSVGHWRTAAHPLLCISVARPQASSCPMFCDRKVPMVL